MTFNDKILLHALPAPLARAIAEQFRAETVDTTAGSNATYALVIAADDAVASLPADARIATPVLSLSTRKPQRLGVILRQARQMISDPVLYLQDIALGTATLNLQDKTISHTGIEDITLTDKEAEILAHLARARGRTVARDALLKDVWRYQPGIDTHTLETHVYRLRQKLSALPDGAALLQTDADGGYHLALPR